MNGKAFLLPLARLLMSSLFVWDGIVQLRSPPEPWSGMRRRKLPRRSAAYVDQESKKLFDASNSWKRCTSTLRDY